MIFQLVQQSSVKVLPILGETAPQVEPKSNCQTSGPIIGSHKLERVSNPCSPNASGMKTGKLVNKNQGRVGSVNKKQNRHHYGNTLSDNENDPNVNGWFTVKISLGTPQQYYNLIVDTGSRWTWVRCQSCTQGCNSTDPLYDPSKSPCKATIPDPFRVEYGDNSFIRGIGACDNLTMDDLGSIMNFQFGCGQRNVDGSGDNFVDAGGFLGLGRGEFSFVSQIGESMQVFSYFVPENGEDADLQFGDKARAKSETCLNRFTPMVQGYEYDQEKYYIDLVGISVDENEVDIPSVSLKTIIDSGTVITRLPEEVYSVFRYAIRQSMLSYTLLEGVDELMDTCYSLEGTESIVFPEIKFHFGQENTIDVTLSKEGTIWKKSDTVICLAFAATKFYKNSIIGIVQQRGFNVLYDLDGERIGFGTNCA